MPTLAPRPLVPIALHHVRTVIYPRRSFSRLSSWRAATPSPGEPRSSAVDQTESEPKSGSPNSEAAPESTPADTSEREGPSPLERNGPARRGVRVHGSALRRSLRNDEWAQEVSKVEFPEWFWKRNVTLREDNDPIRRQDARLGVLTVGHNLNEPGLMLSQMPIRVSKNMLKEEDAPLSDDRIYPETSGVYEWPGDFREHWQPPAIVEALELRTAMEGSFAIARRENGRYKEDVRAHVIAQFPHPGGGWFLEQEITDAACILGADMIRLDALDLSQMARMFLDPNDTRSIAAAQNLGYDTYSASRLLEEEEEETEDLEDDQESDESSDPRLARDDTTGQSRSNRRAQSPFGSVMPTFATISAASIADLGKKLQSGLFSGQGPKALGVPKQFDMNQRSADLRLTAFIEAMLDGAAEKRSKRKTPPATENTFFSSKTVQSSNGIPRPTVFHQRVVKHGGNKVELGLSFITDRQGLDSLRPSLDKRGPRTVICVRDIKELAMTELGEQFVTKLVDVVERRRQEGHQILIVGTSCFKGPVQGDMKATVRNLDSPTEDVRFGLFRQMLLTPHHVSSETRWSNEEASGSPQSDNTSKPWPNKTETGPTELPKPTAAEEQNQKQIKSTLATPESETGGRIGIRGQESLWDNHEADRILDLNLRHLHQSLEHLATNSELTDRVEWAKGLNPSLPMDVRILQHRMLSADEVQQILITALGICGTSSITTDKVQISHVLAAVTLLKESEVEKVAWMTQFASEQNAKPVLQSRSQPDGANKINNAKLERIKQTANRYEKKLMAGVVEPDRIHTTFNDVHAPSETKDALRTITSLQLTRPDAFQYGVLAHNQLSGLLLYGPPGTGKTLFAKAVAKESGATVLEVSGSSVNEMYVGESEKNVGAIFSLARKLSPCIVFIDEADAIFASRSGGRHRVSHREIINQFLKEWDGMEGANVFVMVATNRPFDMDDAVMRRLPRKMLMDLPTEEGREQILRILLKNEALDDSVSLTEFASKTAFYSGSDLKNLCVAAAMACVKQEPETSEKRVLKKGHFETAIAEISASVSEDMSSVQAIRKFDEQYGDRRGRRQKTSLGFMGDAPTESSVRIRG